MPTNIIYLHSHDTGRYVQPMGHAVPTPNLQGLAEEGVLFRRCFCAAPTCSPSRAALLTGQAAHTSGMLGLAHRGFSLHDTGQHLAATLKERGYRTVLAGMQHVGRAAAALGYDEDLGPETLSVQPCEDLREALRESVGCLVRYQAYRAVMGPILLSRGGPLSSASRAGRACRVDWAQRYPCGTAVPVGSPAGCPGPLPSPEHCRSAAILRRSGRHVRLRTRVRPRVDPERRIP